MKRNFRYLFLVMVLAVTMVMGMSVTAFADEPHDLQISKTGGEVATEGVDYEWNGNKLILKSNNLVVSGSTTDEYIDTSVSDIDVFNVTFSNLTINYCGTTLEKVVNIDNAGKEINIQIVGNCAFGYGDNVLNRLVVFDATKTTISGNTGSKISCTGSTYAALYCTSDLYLEGDLEISISNSGGIGIYCDKGLMLKDSVFGSIITGGYGIFGDYCNILTSKTIDVQSGKQSIYEIDDIVLGGSGNIYLKGNFGTISADNKLEIKDNVNVYSTSGDDRTQGSNTIASIIEISTSGIVEISTSSLATALYADNLKIANTIGKVVIRGDAEDGCGALEFYEADALDIGDNVLVYGSKEVDASEGALTEIDKENDFKEGGTWSAYTYFVGNDLAKTVLFKGKGNNPDPKPNPKKPESTGMDASYMAYLMKLLKADNGKKEAPAKEIIDRDTFKSEAPAHTVIASEAATDAFGLFDLKVHKADAKSTANQEFLAKSLVGPNVQILLTQNIYPRRDLSTVENGALKKLTWNNLPKDQAGPVFAVVYNETDGAYVINGVLDANGTAVFNGFKLRAASTITICK